jgi:hypothetical protein
MKPVKTTTETEAKLRGGLPKRLLLSFGALVSALIVVEIALKVAGLPRIYEPHSDAVQFAFTNLGTPENPFYVNYPGRITFRYDGNPRGYFGEENEIHHDVNPSGFRGPAVGPKSDGSFRIVFLGDSFTFGEGVRNEDTFAEEAARQLRKQRHPVEPCNLGVGGYNTSQSLFMLKQMGLGMNPDVVVVGYTLNDAEPPLFRIDPESGQSVRRDRESRITAEATASKPPKGFIYRFRIAQLAWHVTRQRKMTTQTIEYYRSINKPGEEGRIESERALREIISICRERDIPCIILLFPLLFDLSDDYPFESSHERIRKLAEESDAVVIDMLPSLRGRKSHDVIVHPTDQHPNETVHKLAGSLLAETISTLESFKNSP